MKNKDINQIYKEAVLILKHLHALNEQRYKDGKTKVMSESALEFAQIVEETYKNNDLRGLIHLRNDLQQMSKSLPKDSRQALNFELKG